jgi:transposase, IS30 family
VGAVEKSRRGVMLAEKQEWFARLIAQGVSNSEACRIVGINRRTGTRWRYGRTILNTVGQAVHYPPVRLTAPKAPHLAICRWLSERRSLICTTCGRGCARHRRGDR